MFVLKSRGTKVRLAEEHQLIGLIIYSDPKDYTYENQGLENFPEGPGM